MSAVRHCIRHVKDMVHGPERAFVIKTITAGDARAKRYHGMTPEWGGGIPALYTGIKTVRPVAVAVDVGGILYTIRTDENTERRLEGLHMSSIRKSWMPLYGAPERRRV